MMALKHYPKLVALLICFNSASAHSAENTPTSLAPKTSTKTQTATSTGPSYPAILACEAAFEALKTELFKIDASGQMDQQKNKEGCARLTKNFENENELTHGLCENKTLGQMDKDFKSYIDTHETLLKVPVDQRDSMHMTDLYHKFKTQTAEMISAKCATKVENSKHSH